MSEFIGGGMDSITTGSDTREASNAVTEEAVSRVQEQARQAKQVAQQIQKDKDINQKIAQFLSFLLQAIQNDTIISILYNTFFKVTNPKNNITYLRKNLNSLVIAGIFVPFYPDYAERFGLKSMYQTIYNFQKIYTLGDYLVYLQKLSATFHDNIPVDKKKLLDLLRELVQYYKLNTTAPTDTQSPELYKQHIYQQITQQLYGTPHLS